MTQQCKYDEQLLDYVYGELSDTERKSFSDHLPGCSACSSQVQGFGQVRSEFKQQPAIEPAGESMQRMKALLMQAATEQSAAAARSAAPHGGGKLLAFRPRGLRRILLHPAGGVMAVAAAALFYVVLRPGPGMQTVVPEPGMPMVTEAPKAAIAPAATTPPVVPATPVADPAKGAGAPPAEPTTAAGGGALKHAETATAEQAGDGALTRRATVAAGPKPKEEPPADDFAGLRLKSKGAKDADKAPPEPAKTFEAKPQALAKVMASKPMMQLAPVESGSASRTAGAAAGGKAYRQSGSGPAVVAMADQAYEKKAAKKEARDEAEGNRFAQPPPPAPPPPAKPAPALEPAAPQDREEDNSVRGAIARTQEQRKQKVVDELANQELGGISGAPAPSSDHKMAQRSYGSSGTHYKADVSSNTSRGAPSGDSDEAQAPTAVAAAPAAGAPAHPSGTGSPVDEGSTALSTIKDLLRRGQCAEANTALTRLERTFPATHGLAEVRAEYQAACVTPGQSLDGRLRNEATDKPMPAATPPPAAMPAPARERMVNQHQSPPKSVRYASPAEMPAAKAPARAKASKPSPPSENKKAKAVDAASGL